MNISRTAEHATAKGIDFDRALANVKRRHSFSYRARHADRPKEFRGVSPLAAYYGKLQQPIETITDTAEYVRAWCQLNHLKV